jgi:L-rhamnose 1-dehydrogenase
MSFLDLIRKTVIVTGGSQGMGRAVALGFAAYGANVVVNYYPDDDSQKSHIKSLEKEFYKTTGTKDRLLSVAGDISLKETSVNLVDKAINRFGEINVLVCNAGVYPRSKFVATPESLYRKTLAINLDGTFFATQAVGAQMVAQKKGGSIIGISSMTALAGAGDYVHYTISKAGVLSAMNSAAVALGSHGIRCNSILPGTMDTEGNHAQVQDPTYREHMFSRIPLRRFGDPKDVVGPVLFLASDLSSYVTGSHIVVDGGALMFNQ